MSQKFGLFLVLILISSLFMVIVPLYSVAAEPVRVYVNPPSVVDPPMFFNVSVNVENVVGLAGAQWELAWDPTLLSAVNMTEVMFHEATPQSEWGNILRYELDIDNVIGRADYCYAYGDIFGALQRGYCPISGNYTIATIVFQVKSVGNCSLRLTMLLGDDNADPIAHQKVDGSFSNRVPPTLIPISSLESSQVLLYIDPHRVKDETLSVNSTFSVAVKLNSIANDTAMLGFSFDFFWNSTLLDFVNITDVVLHEITPENEWGNIDAEIYYLNKTIGYLIYFQHFWDFSRAMEEGYAPISGNRTLAIVTFRVKGVGGCLLHLSECRVLDFFDIVLLYATIDGYFANTLNGDLNHDNSVNMLDAILLGKHFGTTLNYPNWSEDADINGDRIVNILDAILLCHYLGRTG